MGKPYSMDLRERVVAAVRRAGCRAIRQRSSLGWASARRSTGCGACVRPAALRRARWAVTSRRRFRASTVSGCCSGSRRRLHLARACCRTCRARAEGRLPLGVGVRPRREAQLQKKPWWLANAIVPTSRGGGRSGQSIKIASSLSAWSSSTRPGPRPTWRRCGDGRRAARSHRQGPARPRSPGILSSSIRRSLLECGCSTNSVRGKSLK